MKNFIIDTNVLLVDPEAIFSFQEHTVIIPIGVIEELDRKKNESGVLGRNSRQTSRILDKYSELGDIRVGVPFGEDREGKIRVVYNGALGTYKKEKDVDFHVLHMAAIIREEDPDNECIVISRDTNVRLKAQALGFTSNNYKTGEICIRDGIDDGYVEIKVNRKTYAELKINNECDIEDVFGEEIPWANYYILIEGPKGEKHINARVSYDRKRVERLIGCPKEMKIKPKNKEQAFALDAILDPDIFLVSLIGLAGSGKTLIATAAGEFLVEQEDKYEKLLISRPIQPMGNDIGFLPGDINEKLDPWMQPIYDALEIIHQSNKVQNDSKKGSKKISGKKIAEASDKIFIEPLTYIRGRSIHNQYVIVDESQNLTPLEIKTIITRAGENTKIILTGDIEQIDNPYLDTKTNGLSVVLDAFKDSKYAAHIVMKDGVRSILSEEAAKRL
jgi:PhoH-like ATPase